MNHVSAAGQAEVRQKDKPRRATIPVRPAGTLRKCREVPRRLFGHDENVFLDVCNCGVPTNQVGKSRASDHLDLIRRE